ncbi:MAG TPA: MoaD/ThiS family protein [Candidatus Acidoferrales bacterium]|nr:MoaD/ThiS family protein [Candidatus Acidoferrales bacterium]
MPITIHVPGPLRQFTDGRNEVTLPAPAETVRDALDQLGSLYPGIRDRVLTEQGALRQHINIFVGNEDTHYTGGLTTPLPATAVITIVPAISGGGTVGR